MVHAPSVNTPNAGHAREILATICVEFTDARADQGAIELAQAMAAGRAFEMDMADWDTLFGAVLERLERIVTERPAADGAAPPSEAADRVRTGVRECVRALGQLHAMLAHGRATRAGLPLI